MTRRFISVSSRPGRFGTTVYTELFRRYGVDATYEARLAPPTARELLKQLEQEGIQGCSVSMPLKGEVVPLLDSVAETVKRTQSCNTVYRAANEWRGENTDVDGLRGALAQVVAKHAWIYGYGGVLGSIVEVLREKGVHEIQLAGRSTEKLERAATNWGLETRALARAADLVIVAAPLESVPEAVRSAVIHARWVMELSVSISGVQALAGERYIAGIEMAIHQLVRQFHLYTGKVTTSDEVRQIALEAGLISRDRRGS